MNYIIKTFQELSTKELYNILKARVDVFVVEQECAYPELDGLDESSLHFFIEEDGKIAAYLRAFRLEGEKNTIKIGRVLTVKRGTGLGRVLLHRAIEEVKQRFDPDRIFIEAQSYATGFYEKEGFKICSEEFLEDGIPHKGMEIVFRRDE